MKYKRKRVDGMTNKDMKKLNLDKIKSKESVIVSSKDALKDITPFEWTKEVLSGEKKVIMGYMK